MRVAFRVDASAKIGIGHVMRSLTLANALLSSGASSMFICRSLPEYLRSLILKNGHTVQLLPPSSGVHKHDVNECRWLDVSTDTDASETIAYLEGRNWDWIVIDHYGIEFAWEKSVYPFCEKLIVIDDLANRHHHCDILLDQTLSRQAEDYTDLVPRDCRLLMGAQYALLRSEFSELREYSLSLRKEPVVRRLLISLGGTDLKNVTTKVLQLLSKAGLLKGISTRVVLGSGSTTLKSVKLLVSKIDEDIELLIDIENMAEIISLSDLVIGAAGTSSWERCCLGAPTIMLVLADNQKLIAQAIEEAGAAISLGSPDQQGFGKKLKSAFAQIRAGNNLIQMSRKAALITNGNGVSAVSELMTLTA